MNEINVKEIVKSNVVNFRMNRIRNEFPSVADAAFMVTSINGKDHYVIGKSDYLSEIGKKADGYLIYGMPIMQKTYVTRLINDYLKI